MLLSPSSLLHSFPYPAFLCANAISTAAAGNNGRLLTFGRQIRETSSIICFLGSAFCLFIVFSYSQHSRTSKPLLSDYTALCARCSCSIGFLCAPKMHHHPKMYYLIKIKRLYIKEHPHGVSNRLVNRSSVPEYNFNIKWNAAKKNITKKKNWEKLWLPAGSFRSVAQYCCPIYLQCDSNTYNTKLYDRRHVELVEKEVKRRRSRQCASSTLAVIVLLNTIIEERYGIKAKNKWRECLGYWIKQQRQQKPKDMIRVEL